MALNQAGKPGRAVPDISADADPKSGMLLGLVTTKPNGKPRPYETFLQAGTSLATPLVAGMVADAEQGQPRNFGFLNPLLYSLAGSQAFHDILPVSPSDPQVDRAFYTQGDTDINNKFAPGFLVGVNDAQDPSGTHQVTAPGYDTITGLGTPNGRAFIKGLQSGKKHPTRRRSRRHRPGNGRGRGSRSTRHHGVRRRSARAAQRVRRGRAVYRACRPGFRAPRGFRRWRPAGATRTAAWSPTQPRDRNFPYPAKAPRGRGHFPTAAPPWVIGEFFAVDLASGSGITPA
jgi:hypothetical protein